MNTSARRSPRPFLPEDLAAPPGNRFRAGRYIERAAFASALQCVDRGRASIEQTIRAVYGADPVTRLVVNRASVSPASTTTPAWAGSLAGQAVGDFIASLAPTASAKLIEAGLRVNLTGVNTLALPRRSALPSALDSAWTVEGAPHPVAQFALATAVLGPMRKLTLSVALTQEAVAIGGEDVVRTMLRESAAYTLDATMFSTAAATAARPAGLLNGITALSATAGGGEAAMIGDLEKLAGAVAAGGGSGNVVFIASPRQAASAALRLGTDRAQTVWASPALAAGTVLAVDPSGFASAFGPEPTIDASIEAVVHFEDTTPLPISTPAVAPDPNVVSAPVRSAFQSDLVVLRCRLDAAYTMRQPGLVAHVTGLTWG